MSLAFLPSIAKDHLSSYNIEKKGIYRKRTFEENIQSDIRGDLISP